MKKIKVLMINPGLNLCGGIESFVMNYYRQLKDNVDFDFATHDISTDEYKKEIQKNGNKVFLFPKMTLKNMLEELMCVLSLVEKMPRLFTLIELSKNV